MQHISGGQSTFMRYLYEREFCRPSAIFDQEEGHRVGTMIQKLNKVARLSCERNHKSNLTKEKWIS